MDFLLRWLLPTKATPCKVPSEGAVFQLTLDADRIDPFGMALVDNVETLGLKFEGKRLKGRITKSFQLLCFGDVKNTDDAEMRASAQGKKLARGEWREAFLSKFPYPDGPDCPYHIAFGSVEAKWVSEKYGNIFPILYHGFRRHRGEDREWIPNFSCATDIRSYTLWLVEDK